MYDSGGGTTSTYNNSHPFFLTLDPWTTDGRHRGEIFESIQAELNSSSYEYSWNSTAAC